MPYHLLTLAPDAPDGIERPVIINCHHIAAIGKDPAGRARISMVYGEVITVNEDFEHLLSILDATR